jgi:hypothetical protein
LWRVRSSDQMDVVIHLLLCFLQRFRLVAFHPIEVFTKMSETRQTKKPWNCKAFQKTYIYIQYKSESKNDLSLWCLSSLPTLILSILGIALSTFSARFLSYLSGLFRFLSNSKVES